jgi:LPXTG-motif cell wall-anchored protein
VRGIRNGDGDLDRRLRELGAEPSAELLDSIASRVGVRRRAWSRVAFVAAIATLVLGTFSSFGGIGYAAAGADQGLNTIAHSSATAMSSADRQYKPGKASAVGHVKAAGPVKAAKVQGQTLPFTGFSLVWTAVAGFSLLLLGFLLRRREQGR